MDAPQPTSGELCLCATPIGDFDDITVRALRKLREADLVLAEDTRRTGQLLAHHGIKAQLRAFHAHSPDAHVQQHVARVRSGQRLVLVSDAGTPIVSDPGGRLAEAVRDAGLRLVAAPGASAVLTALSVAGLRADRFRFIGFLARQGSRRREALEQAARSDEATVLFESPRRLAATLADFAPLLGTRRLAVCRELTKHFEEVLRGSASELAAHFQDGAKGEITLVIEGRRPGSHHDQGADPDALIREGIAAGTHPRELAKAVAARSPLSRKEAYERIVRARAEDDAPA